MKKLIVLLLGLFLVPSIVNAKVDINTFTRYYKSDVESCKALFSENDASELSSAEKGYYLTCAEVVCQDAKYARNDYSPMEENLTCANGNPNPYKRVASSGASYLAKTGDACDGTTVMQEAANPNVYINETIKYSYDCARNNDGSYYGDLNVSDKTNTNVYYNKELCLDDVKLNKDTILKNATSGYYLTCYEVTCGYDFNIKEFSDLSQVGNELVCQNQNKDPYVVYKSSRMVGAPQIGNSCDQKTNTENVSNKGTKLLPKYIDLQEETVYGTYIYEYDCNKLSNGGEYSQPTTKAPELVNPQTGIKNIYVLIGSSLSFIAGVSIFMYIVNKKSLFKKI